MKILWQSNGMLVPSGYGNQTGLFVPALKNAGHDMTVFAFYGQQGNPTVDQNGIPTLPPAVDAYGNDVIGSHMAFCQARLLITLIDPFVLDPQAYGALPWCAWTPIDSDPMLVGNKHSLQGTRWIWSMSQFGHKVLAGEGFNNVTYVPHGVDVDVFKPVDRTEARERAGKFIGADLTGKFLISYNAANTGTPPRKAFYECLAAFKQFSDKYPEAVLYLHTDQHGRRGVNLPAIMAMLKLDPSKVLFPPDYKYLCGLIPPVFLNDLYNASDVYFHPSMGEGFGIPVLEAQASGCPAILSDNTALTELCFGGWLVDCHPFMNGANQVWQAPEIDQLVAALEDVYHMAPDDILSLRARVRERALEYDYREVLKRYMLPAIEAMGAQMDDQAERCKPVSVPARKGTQ